ncbi:unnamed protein product [Amoebophrya sp. A120]|nr:unnamed protein product [Amoebophrya sp. A120]|eukprot:GSA120T00021876001.1
MNRRGTTDTIARSIWSACPYFGVLQGRLHFLRQAARSCRYDRTHRDQHHKFVFLVQIRTFRQFGVALPTASCLKNSFFKRKLYCSSFTTLSSARKNVKASPFVPTYNYQALSSVCVTK